MPELTKEMARKLFTYDHEKGWLINRISRCRARTGDRAGSQKKNVYRTVCVNGSAFLEHRIIWVYFNGSISVDQRIDHINRIPNDNRIENLRLATAGENRRNVTRKKPGYKRVVVLPSGRFHATLSIGTFNTAKEAAQAAYQAAKKLYGEFITPESYGLTVAPTCATLED